ncbi:WhiB family transcriptional regulator [Mycobacteroides immunogenum]|uniref:WhiB family transcriptional regulator n=1 Tax=Mycobacteroides immunogenum TaxID=83262 RepID=UPI0009BE69B9
MIDFEPPPFRDGICRETDPDLFHQIDRGGVEAAKRVCRGCPRMLECRDWILDLEARLGERQSGVWGGLAARARPKPKKVFCGSGLHRIDESWDFENGRCSACRSEAQRRLDAEKIAARRSARLADSYSWMDEVDAPWAS